MKIIQDFKCYALNETNSKKTSIDFELTKYQQTKWKFFKENTYFIESSIHWNMLLFYIYNNQNENKNKISFLLQKKTNSYYTFSVEINEINQELESIIFLFFYYDIHNRDENVINIRQNIYEWNNLYLDIKEKKIYSKLNQKIKTSRKRFLSF